MITVHFHVPVPPLAWDTTLAMPHQSAYTEWAQGRGFEVRAGTTRIAISGVAIAGDSVQITCATDPPASGVVVGYAFTADGTLRPNGTVRWGQLRDSDPFVGSLYAGRAAELRRRLRDERSLISRRRGRRRDLHPDLIVDLLDADRGARDVQRLLVGEVVR